MLSIINQIDENTEYLKNQVGDAGPGKSWPAIDFSKIPPLKKPPTKPPTTGGVPVKKP
jgi:hypothetical protein